uniref:Uncharacterized protein n=1 Tax=Candidatus Kentrum sp. SD TaxID=2126332 RepID=A0A450Z7N8_9GAMM|nr:MAG: hypothetical protein BECKSD772F_GA0070984_12232 [Candidatus Kentron sp. SD]VFK49830.1 MAG: hypothetical protein BECKSD772E_GA0070983_12505 [Candidatus Kentron sp. SD]VFK80761.1 MAG: hypothetical protein BECKSD772D_GA0070982_11532 [Candidatus Kentron sp. SD]
MADNKTPANNRKMTATGKDAQKRALFLIVDISGIQTFQLKKAALYWRLFIFVLKSTIHYVYKNTEKLNNEVNECLNSTFLKLLSKIW